MRNTLILFILSFIILGACQQVKEEKSIDIDAEKKAIGFVIDKYNKAIKTKDIDLMIATSSDDLLVCGSDPSEFWNKKEIIAIWNEMLSESGLDITIF